MCFHSRMSKVLFIVTRDREYAEIDIRRSPAYRRDGYDSRIRYIRDRREADRAMGLNRELTGYVVVHTPPDIEYIQGFLSYAGIQRFNALDAALTWLQTK